MKRSSRIADISGHHHAYCRQFQRGQLRTIPGRIADELLQDEQQGITGLLQEFKAGTLVYLSVTDACDHAGVVVRPRRDLNEDIRRAGTRVWPIRAPLQSQKISGINSRGLLKESTAREGSIYICVCVLT